MSDPEMFDLNGLVRKVRDEVGPDPAAIAAKVEPLIPSEHRSDVLRRLLEIYCRVYKPTISNVRFAARAIQPDPSAKAGRVKPAKSAKVALLQQHARLFRVSVCVAPSRYVELGDCNIEQLVWAADNRRSHAAQTLSAAEDYEWLAGALKKYRKKTVRELPAHVLDEFLNRRADTDEDAA